MLLTYGFPLEGDGFHYRVILLKILKVVFSQKFGIFWKISYFFFKLHVQGKFRGSRNPQIFWNIFEQITPQKQSLFYSNMPCFSKMGTTNDYSLFLKNGFHKWQWVSIKGSLPMTHWFPLQGDSITGCISYKYSLQVSNLFV